MAYQKLQVGTGVAVIPSDTVDIPNVGGPSQSGTADGTTANKLVDSTAAFTGNLTGYIVYNTTDSTAAYVVGVDSATQLSLSADIMASGEAYVLYADTNPGCVLYIGTAGTGGVVRVLTASGADLTFNNVSNGTFLPVQVKRVFDTDTSASNILALW